MKSRSKKQKMYSATVKPENVYDGDTIEKVRVVVYPMPIKVEKPIKLWPNIYLTSEGITAEFSLRLAGIDTPEIHPHRYNDVGILRSDKSLATEKDLAQKAKQALIDYLRKYDFKIWIKDEDDGKYAGRIVCSVFVKDTNDKLRSVSNYMLTNNYARPYFGGTKSKWA